MPFVNEDFVTHPLIGKIVESHGGAVLWKSLHAIEAEISVSGFLFRAKHRPSLTHVHVRVLTESPHFTFFDFPAPGQRAEFLGADEVRIIGAGGEIISRRTEPRKAFRGMRRQVCWDALDFIYFGGYATWNYLVTPFLFLRNGFQITEIKGPPVIPPDWTVLRVTFPEGLPTHCRNQVFYFDDQMLLRRLDYTAEVVGRWAHAAHFCEAYHDFGGLKAPTRRRVLPLPFGPNPLPGPVLVSIEVHNMRLMSA